MNKLPINIEDYAIQGNAILGIKESGKSYTATLIAERLLNAGVPFVAFDPIGVWRFLRVPGGGAGHQVVVAGGQQGDLPLTPDSAPEIVAAAMRANVPLVIDLYDMTLSKADWHKIVERCVRLLLYRNGEHGPRHIFIEEAAEFVPQRLGDGQQKVYAEIEKLARMGGNAGLGYTLINQRAEEVNKAVLEICDCYILHRQVGRNSLIAIRDWLKLVDESFVGEIVKSLPRLKAGEAWVWERGKSRPELVAMPAKQSYHPNRRDFKARTGAQAYKPVDVAGFIQQLTSSLDEVLKRAKDNDPAVLRKRIGDLERELSRLSSPLSRVQEKRVEVPVPVITDADKAQIAEITRLVGVVEAQLGDVKARVGELHHQVNQRLAVTMTPRPASAKPTRSIVPVKQAPAPAPTHAPVVSVRSERALSRPQQAILDALAWLESVGVYQADRVRAAMLADQSPRSSGYEKNVSTLKTAGLIDYPAPGVLCLTDAGRAAANAPGRPMTTGELHAAIRGKISRPQWGILDALIGAYPDALTREELAERAGQSALSSGFEKNVSTMRSLGFLDYPSRGAAVATPVLFVEE